MSKKVLIVDDSMYMRTLIKDTLKSEGYEIVGEAANGETAIDLAMELSPDLITLDNILPDMIGTDILKVFKDQGISSKVIMVSAVGQQSVINEGIELGASEYIVKPFTSEDLLAVVNRVV
ncbi:two-component system, chemotaxis family, response regulator CheY [Reichenbachiella faecimaris]|uniref:Two-component system, chemotaxis family, response regulator CheY n=1 Tax=Reichenbachiella faecimaris TaxID=692418 RepID=A0A1W2G9E0_REIFA|nr:response regulator [Reichenbachiella faecimaris]SMD32916.1 two-component system, chemotaxis family, response regulator CheY [Reichenbachiella faecimaris]